MNVAIDMLRLCELGTVVLAVVGLCALAWLVVGAQAQLGDLGSASWLLVGLSAGLCLSAGILAYGGGWWDAQLRRVLRRHPRPTSAADRWLNLCAAVLLLAGAVAEAGSFKALCDGRAGSAAEAVP